MPYQKLYFIFTLSHQKRNKMATKSKVPAKKPVEPTTFRKTIHISETLEERLQACVSAKGVKDTQLIITALDHYLSVNNF